jgi:hypothetical protein
MTDQKTTTTMERVGEVTVRVRLDDEGRFHFSGEDARNVMVSADGDLHVRTQVGADAEVELRFALDDPANEFLGIQLSSGDEDWKRHPTVLDTAGAFYRDGLGAELPFRVAPSAEEHPLAALILTQVGGLVPEGAVWLYKIHLRRGGETFSHDPKIYNEGDGGGPR